MKLKTVAILCAGSAFILTSALAQALNANKQPELFNLVQRYCTTQDITITNDSTLQVPPTTCTWLREAHNDDNNIQVTLHMAKDVDLVVGHCTFTSVGGDTLSSVTTSKSTSNSGGSGPTFLDSYSITGNTDVILVVKNHKTNLDTQGLYQGNVVFNLAQSNSSYHVGDQIRCAFAPLIAPAAPAQ